MKKILVIDDNADISENTAEILVLAGYEAYTASDGKRGVEIALEKLPDLIVCDIMMPELDGYGTLHLLKKNPLTEHIPFIFLTAKAERNDFRKGMELGADDFITKPFDDLELLRAIERQLKKAETAGAPTKEQTPSPVFSCFDPLQYECERFGRKHILYNAQRRPKNLYYLKSGKAKTFRLHEEGKEYITNLYHAGDYIGYLELLENTIYEDTAQLLDECEVCIIPKEDFAAAINADVHTAGQFIKIVSRNLRQQEDRLLQLAYDSLRKRVAKGLVAIHCKFNTDHAPANLEISRDDIAQFIGTATESLIRTLSDFKSERLIEIKEGKIRIINFEKISKLMY